MTVRAASTAPTQGIPATAEADSREPGGATPVDVRVAELCERLRQLAHRAGEDALRAARQRAEVLVAEAREQIHAESQAQVARARERLARQREREIQGAQLEVRAEVAWCRWRELDTVLDAAERYAESLRNTEPERYLNALRRFLDAARAALPGRAWTVRANPDDLTRLQCSGVRSADESEKAHVAEPNVRAGLLMTSADGSVFIDHTIASRRRRLDDLLRLTAAEVLFAGREPGSGQASAGM